MILHVCYEPLMRWCTIRCCESHCIIVHTNIESVCPGSSNCIYDLHDFSDIGAVSLLLSLKYLCHPKFTLLCDENSLSAAIISLLILLRCQSQPCTLILLYLCVAFALLLPSDNKITDYFESSSSLNGIFS